MLFIDEIFNPKGVGLPVKLGFLILYNRQLLFIPRNFSTILLLPMYRLISMCVLVRENLTENVFVG